MSKRRQERSAEIARAAIGPLSAEGVRNVRLSDIGASLGMTGAHLLYYFESKNDLFMASLRIVEQDLRDQVHATFESIESARDRWQWLLDTGAPTGLDDSGLLMWLEAWSGAVHDKDVLELITELESEWQGLLHETLEYAVARGELPSDIDAGPIVEGVSALLDGLTLRVVVGYRPIDHGVAMTIIERFVGPLLPWRDLRPAAEETS